MIGVTSRITWAGVLVVAALPAAVGYAVPIATWDFNDSSAPFAPATGAGTLTFDGFLPHYQLAQGGVSGAAGDHALALYNIYNLTEGSLVFQISTAGFDDIGMSLWARTTDGAFSQDDITFSIDLGSGVFTPLAATRSFNPGSAYALYTPDLTGLDLGDKPGVQIMMTLSGAQPYADGTPYPQIGYLALDNVQFTGDPVLALDPPDPPGNPEPATLGLALLALAALGARRLPRRQPA